MSPQPDAARKANLLIAQGKRSDTPGAGTKPKALKRIMSPMFDKFLLFGEFIEPTLYFVNCLLADGMLPVSLSW